MTNLSQVIRRFNRFELKYILSIQQAYQIMQELQAYLIPDDYGNLDGAYQLTSLYYDSPDYRCYWEKVDGVKFRRKLRIRQYTSENPVNEETPVLVEIKQRLDRGTQKRRAVLPYLDALRLCNDRQIPCYTLKDEPIIQEVFAYIWQYNLQPSSVIQYSRQAMIGTEFDMGLRVTFDTKIYYQVMHPGLRSQFTFLPLFPENMVIMEIKVNERIPFWLTELVAKHNLSMVRVSKYCQSIELSKRYQSESLPVSICY